MIKEFDFSIFPFVLFVSNGSTFEELQESFVFHTEEDGYVELGDERFNSWGNANGVTVNVIDKENMRNGILVINKINRTVYR